MDALEQVFYVSQSLASPARVEELLDQSRALNALSQVTGALLFTGGYVAQMLEGSAESIQSTMGRIVVDPRHTGVRRLKQGPIVARRFAGWTMASSQVEGADDLLAHLMAVREVSMQRVTRLIDLMFENVVPRA